MRYYRAMSHRIFKEVFSRITDRIEQVSVDECYMDVSGAALLLEMGQSSAIGAWIREQVALRYNITCSVGIAANKLVAKMASTNAKPNGMLMIPVARHAQFVQMMPLRGIPGIGPSLEKRLNAWGVNSVADLACMSLESLEQATGSALSAHGLYQAARGLDDSPSCHTRRKNRLVRNVPSKLTRKTCGRCVPCFAGVAMTWLRRCVNVVSSHARSWSNSDSRT